MLRVTKIKDGANLVKYHDEALVADDHYYVKKEITAIWSGKTAERLGLSNNVNREDFSKIAHNIHPKTGERLTVRNATNRRAAYDLTFNCPKSVSLVYAITKDEDILTAQKEAVRQTLAMIEQDIQTQSNQFKKKNLVHTGNLVHASFMHFTTRPVKTKHDEREAYYPDPHLHIHSIVFNCTWNEKQQRYQAIEMGTIHKLLPYYESAYHSFLSYELTKAGYPIESIKDKWEIKNISRNLIMKFSNRTLQIEAIAKEKGITDAKAKANLGARTRSKKNKTIAEHKLYQLWEQRLDKKELFHVQSIKGSVDNHPINTITAQQANDKSLNHYLERKSVVAEKRVLGQALSYGYGILLPKDVQNELDNRDNILSAFKQTIKYITTKKMVHAEDKMLEMAAASKGLFTPLNNHYKIQQDFLSDEQRAAVQQLLQSRDRITILMGAAGVGKTSLLTEYKAGVEETGKQLLAFAPSAAASRGVLRDKGFEGSDTVASLLKNKELQGNLKNNVLLLDEAGMVSTQTMLEILQIANLQNARVVLSGDPKQHSSIQAGDALRQLQERAQLQTATVKTVVRQNKNEPYRQAIQAMAEGDTLKGFDKLDKIKAVIEIADTDQREEQLAIDYAASVKAGRSALVVSPTHAEGNSITHAIRAQLRKEKIITGKERQYSIWHNLSLTEAQKQDFTQYDPGTHIRFHQNAKGGFKAGQAYKVLDPKDDDGLMIQSLSDNKIHPLPIEHFSQYEAYREQITPFAKGDLIRVSRNGTTREDTKIHNGQTYTIKGFTREGHIKLSNGKTLDKDFKHFGNGAVSTSYGAQGKDAEDVFVAQGGTSLPASNDKQFYVSASRGRERVFIYTEDKIELRQAILRNTDRMSALEVADQHYTKISQQRRLDYYKQETNKDVTYDKTTNRQPQQNLPEPEGK